MTLAEVRSAFAGVVLIFRGRREGLALMDRSVDGFWRSFLAVLLVIPSDALAQVALIRLGAEGPFGVLFLERLPLLLLDFALMPLLLATIARPLGLSRTFVDFVVARNWGAPLAAAISAVPFVLAAAGLIGPNAAVYISLGIYALALRYVWMALRIALDATVPLAAALLATDIFVSLLLFALFTAE